MITLPNSNQTNLIGTTDGRTQGSTGLFQVAQNGQIAGTSAGSVALFGVPSGQFGVAQNTPVLFGAIPSQNWTYQTQPGVFGQTQQIVGMIPLAHGNTDNTLFAVPNNGIAWSSNGIGNGLGACTHYQAHQAAGLQIRVDDNDSEYVYECFSPVFESKNTDVTFINNNLRIRVSQGRGNEAVRHDLQTVAVPSDVDSTRISAISSKGYLKVTLPRQKKVVENIRKIKIG